MMGLFRATAHSLRWELAAIFIGLGVVLALPCIALFSLTNTTALANGSDGTLYTDTANPQDDYDYGECTYWAALRRIQISQPIPNTWGNAATWAVRAQSDGYLVDYSPSFGSIMQTPNAAGGLGHVAFVESIDMNNGGWTISEMNVLGWDIVDTHTYLASAAQNYSFIH